MKVIKPLSLSVLFRPFTHRRTHRLAVTALGFFPLGDDAESFLVENVQWPKVMAALPPGELLDAAMPKANGEVLLTGCAHAPEGKAKCQMDVRLTVGAIDKRLRIFGDRQWSYGLLPLHQISAPKPFTAMPITYDRAYGGPAYANNPQGQGHTGERLGAFIGINEGRMPNIEQAQEPITSHCGRYVPAGFGPLDLRLPQRQKKAGTYNARWLAEGFPGLADDIDFAVFNAAPEDQQQKEFFEGGERYRLEGLHRDHAVVEGTVPAMRVRALIQRKDRSATESEELAMVMDTLWLLPEADLGVAIYRGTIEVSDSDALDVAALMVGYERIARPPRPLAWYREVFALRVDPETALAHALNESQLTPEKSEQEQAQRRAEDAAAEAKEAAAMEAKLQAVCEEFATRTGMDTPLELAHAGATSSLLGPIPIAAIQRGDLDLTPILARAKAVAEQAKAEGEARLAQAQAIISELKMPPEESVEEQKREAEERAQPREAISIAIPADHGLDDAQARALRDAQAQLPKLQHEARRVAPEPQAQRVNSEVADHLGQLVRQWLAVGESLAGRDLTGASLRGIDLRGLDLRETIFEQADLTNALLQGADLRGAVFTAATLCKSDFSQADLRQSNLCKANARGALFVGAKLCEVMALNCDLSEADLTGADLTRIKAAKVRLDGALLERADLTEALLFEAQAQGVKLRGACMNRAICYGAQLDRADLSAIFAERTVFTAITANGSLWRDAHLRDVHLGLHSQFKQADLRGIDASGCGWRGADLTGADLREAILAESDLGECCLDGAKLDGALLARAVLGGTTLRNSSAIALDLYQALCRKADFSGADLRKANFYGATLFEARMEKCRLAGARHSRQREILQ